VASEGIQEIGLLGRSTDGHTVTETCSCRTGARLLPVAGRAARFRTRWLGKPSMPFGFRNGLVSARRPFPTSALGFGVNGLSTPLWTPSGVIKSNAPLPLTAGRSRVSDTLRSQTNAFVTRSARWAFSSTMKSVLPPPASTVISPVAHRAERGLPHPPSDRRTHPDRRDRTTFLAVNLHPAAPCDRRRCGCRYALAGAAYLPTSEGKL